MGYLFLFLFILCTACRSLVIHKDEVASNSSDSTSSTMPDSCEENVSSQLFQFSALPTNLLIISIDTTRGDTL
jgi:hypothetical protein